MPGTSTAAADTDKPEQTGTYAEGDCKPVYAEHARAEGHGDVVRLQGCSEGPNERGKEDGAGESGEDGEESGGLMIALAMAVW